MRNDKIASRPRNEIISVGFVPLFALVFYNSRIYLKIRASSKFENRHVGSASVKSTRL